MTDEIKLNLNFFVGAVAGILTNFIFAFLALPISFLGFVISVWVYLAIHSRGYSVSLKQAALFPVLYTVLYDIFVLFGGIAFVSAGLFSLDFIDRLFPITTQTCFLVDIVITFILAVVSGGIFWFVKKQVQNVKKTSGKSKRD